MATTISSSARTAPGPRGHPLAGVLHEVRRDPLRFLVETARTYGPVARYRLGPLRSYLVTDPEGVKHVLQEHVRNYTKDHFSYGMVRWVAGNGLLTSQGDFWLRQRRLAQPAFHRQRIASFGTGIVRAAGELAESWAPSAARGVPVDAAEAFTNLTLRIVGEALFGAGLAEKAPVVSRSFTTLSDQLVTRFRTMRVLPPVLPWGIDRTFRAEAAALSGVVYGIIAERRARGEDTGDLLSLLMFAQDEETGERMDDRQLHDEVLTMLVAGHETTATALAWVVALLGQHPEVEQKLHAELDAVLAGRDPEMADLPRLPYTRMVIDETLRLYPPVYVLSRKVMEDDEIGGFRIPAGSSVDISPYATHRSPALWERPDSFEPERFAPELVAARHRYAYFPFSGGPRQCIGNTFALVEAQLVLATIARRYRLRPVSDTLPVPEPLITLRPRGGLPVVLEARE
jgi:cytochrome P450